MERPNPEDDSGLPADPAPASDPEPTPRYPQGPTVNHEARPETLANNTRVSGLAVPPEGDETADESPGD